LHRSYFHKIGVFVLSPLFTEHITWVGCHTEALEVLRGGVLNDVFVLMNCSRRSLPRGLVLFVLTQKNQKVKTEKAFYPQGQLPARFSVWHLRAKS
jgi:hypothetical protein